jgi:predicted Fe-Mo cluster-binding NifX family protein
MKIAVSATGKDLNTQIDPRFGRCAYFIIVDTNDMSFASYDNENSDLSGGAGIQAAGFIVSKGAEALLTGNCGPNAMTIFATSGVTVYTGQTGKVGEAVERFKTKGLTPSTQPSVAEKAGNSTLFGTGSMPAKGTGRCLGGSGRGIGGGGGRGMSIPDSGSTPITSTPSGKEALTVLKRQAEDLRQQMEAIQAKIDSIE